MTQTGERVTSDLMALSTEPDKELDALADGPTRDTKALRTIQLEMRGDEIYRDELDT